MKAILFILITFSLTYADFIRSNEMVTDTVNGLVWEDDTIPLTMTWQGAIDYCEVLSLGGKYDWRLPNNNELTSLVDDTSYPLAISNAFQNIPSDGCWSSTSFAYNNSMAWIFYFDNGLQFYDNKAGSYYVRCVRGGQ